MITECKTKVFNVPERIERYIVARVVENELWYFTSLDNKEDAERTASILGEYAIVLNK